MKIFYDIDYGDYGSFYGNDKETDYDQSKALLIEYIMARCGITESDLDDITIVKSKLRGVNIDEILNTENV